jgi:DNA-directed RNA polymerase specialized sigma24 family protein
MSPLALRRYRAERLLREEFEALRERVLHNVRGRLRASGVSLDLSDLEACYAQAWQGLYLTVLGGQDISNPAGWLALVTFRRAIEEHRARRRAHPPGSADHAAGELEPQCGREVDLAAELDDRVRLHQLFEGLRGRLGAREREAAVLCYLQGLSRAEAAVRMGVSEARMRKLMEGRGVGRPGVAGKVGALAETIRTGGWCEEQGSLMRGLAYGILDPEGERYQLALMHRSRCPACRAYVVSLRGLAGVLPPVLLPSGIGAAALLGSGAASAGVGLGRGIGAVSASGAGAGTGGGWLLAGGPLVTKLAAGCLLAVGVGAGCIALEPGSARAPAPHMPLHARSSGADPGGASPALGHGSLSAARRSAAPRLTSVAAAGVRGREFGPEQGLASGAGASLGSRARLSARSASVALEPAPSVATGSAGSSRAGPAAREFAPG